MIFGFFLGGVSVAQDDPLESYLTETDQINQALLQTVSQFVNEVKPLKQQKDLLGLKDATDKYIGLWDQMLTQIDQVQAPDDAGLHHQSLRRMVELQRESNQIMSETLEARINLIREVQNMKKAGSTDDELKTYIQENSADRDELLAKTSKVKDETIQVDATIKKERQRLGETLPAKE